MDNEKDISQLKNRLRDLADKAYRQDILTYSSFLNASEIDVFYQLQQELSYANPALYGGHDMAERMIVRFGDSEAGSRDFKDFPIQCIHIKSSTPKFAEKLSHRDFLGALMNLGIERQTIGDIMVNEKEAWIFALDRISDYICENLYKVKHNNVKCSIVTDTPDMPQSTTKDISIQVASLRLDAVVAKVCNISREKALELFRTSCVFVNGRLTENNSKALVGNEIISVRGYGKFMITDNIRETKKGKLSVVIRQYC